MDINFLTYDSRAHGRSEGHLYTLGVKEATDVTHLIDEVLAAHPDMSFGIYARGNTSNIALKALSQDSRLRYGIVEYFYENPMNHLQYLNYDDVLIQSTILNEYVLDRSLKFLDQSRTDLNLKLDNITQPMLMLSTPYNYDAMQQLSNYICSDDKQVVLFNENIYLEPWKQDDEGYVECIKDFLEINSIS